MDRPNLQYTSFLVRLWPDTVPSATPQTDNHTQSDVANPKWMAQVEYIPGGEQQYFISLEDLFAFIRAQLSGQVIQPAET